MAKKFANSSAQFGNQLKLYLLHFNLFPADVAYLLKTNTENINQIISGDKGVVLNTVEKIADIFGLSYYEMGNPEYPIPQLDSLPKNTLTAIKKRQNEGEPRKYGKHDFAGALDKLLDGDFLKEPHTAKEIFAQLPKVVKDAVANAARVSDLLKREPRSLRVKRIKIEGKKELKFQLIESMGK